MGLRLLGSYTLAPEASFTGGPCQQGPRALHLVAPLVEGPPRDGYCAQKREERHDDDDGPAAAATRRVVHKDDVRAKDPDEQYGEPHYGDDYCAPHFRNENLRCPGGSLRSANTTNFVLNSRLNLVIAAEYLRVGSSTSPAGLPALPLSGGTTWVTVAVTGLPAYGPDYEVTAGECSHGRAVSLGTPESSAADPAGVLILQVSNLPASFDSSRFWIQISSVTGQILAEIRGPIFPVTNGRLIAPGTSICRAA